MTRLPEHLQPRQLPILFVCGLHRSGTSVFSRLVATSPSVRPLTGTGAPEDEGQHLQHIYPTAEMHGGPGLFAFDPGSHVTERDDLATANNARSVIRAWAPYWKLHDTDRLHWGPGGVVVLEKSPPNLLRTRLLQALFPEARFVTLVRNPAVVCASTAVWRPRLSPGTLLRHWVHAHSLYRRDLPHLLHARTLRYEDLLADPCGVVGRLAAALEFDGTVDLSELEAGHNERRLQDWQALFGALSTSERRTIEREIRRYGYSLAEPYVEDPSESQFFLR
jgi:hypothetical protein